MIGRKLSTVLTQMKPFLHGQEAFICKSAGQARRIVPATDRAVTNVEARISAVKATRMMCAYGLTTQTTTDRAIILVFFHHICRLTPEVAQVTSEHSS